MKVTNGILAFVSGFAFAGAAMAQDAAVSAEKTAPIKTLLPDAYGSTELRYVNRRVMEGDKVANDLGPRFEARPTLGTTLFGGSVDTAFTWIFRHEAATNSINKVVLYNETQWNVVSGKYGAWGPYAYVEQSSNADEGFGIAQLGFNGELKTTLDLGFSALDLSAASNPIADFLPKQARDRAANKVVAENKTDRPSADLGFSLTDDGKPTVAQRDPSLNNITSLSAKLKPTAVTGLTLGAGLDYIQRWVPQYTVEDVDGETRTSLDHYSNPAITISKVSVGYKLTDKVTITNQLRHNINGFYERGLSESRPDETDFNVGKVRWENRLSLNAVMF